MKAIVSDIHANVAAWEAVKKDLKSHNITDIISLGDLVGYGPEPVEIIDEAMDFRINLMGNHDEAVVFEPVGFNYRALTAIRWTKKSLTGGLFGFKNKKRMSFLKGLKLTHREDGALMVHGSPREPTTEYILKHDALGAAQGVPEAVKKLNDIFGQFEDLCFVGHTHIPCVIDQEFRYQTEKDFEYEFKAEKGKKYIINVGSVGQPRDRDTRACYVIWDGRKFIWRRVEYDVTGTARKIRALKELDDYNADRLEQGV
ncbi:MAG: metallophosphoesterase family protein [Planctomycetes bacterium]|nr:metallophosphoesterase family protein [Planctomycetota bacterium]